MNLIHFFAWPKYTDSQFGRKHTKQVQQSFFPRTSLDRVQRKSKALAKKKCLSSKQSERHKIQFCSWISQMCCEPSRKLYRNKNMTRQMCFLFYIFSLKMEWKNTELIHSSSCVNSIIISLKLFVHWCSHNEKYRYITMFVWCGV